jgi:hypothetical protein
MKREMRLEIFEKELAQLLGSERDGDYVVFFDLADTDRHVQFFRQEGAMFVEVSGARRGAATALGCVGFSACEAGAFSRADAPQDARKLACLAELVFGAAYGPTEGVTVVTVSRTEREAQWRKELEA